MDNANDELSTVIVKREPADAAQESLKQSDPSASPALPENALMPPQLLQDIGDIAFEDLFDLAAIQRLQDDFCAATHVAALITRPDGSHVTAPSNFCRLCRDIIRKSDKGIANCKNSDASLGQYHPGEPIIRPCLSAGLWGAGSSIQVNGKHIANWLIGQVRDGAQTEEGMRQYARELEIDEEEFVKAFHDVPYMSRDHFERVATMLNTLANQLSTVAYQNLQQARFIAERRRTEEALRESEERLRLALAGADLGAWDWHIPSGATIFNERWASMLGYTLDEIEPHARAWQKLLHPDDRSYVMKTLQDHLEGKTKGYEAEHRLRHKSGEWIWVLDRGCVIQRDAEGKPVRACGTHLDITAHKQAEKERRNLETQLTQAQKMESVGRLAGGVAHDFNNLLTAILGYAELELESSEQLAPQVQNSFHQIHKAAERARDLTHQLLTFGRKQMIDIRPLNLNAVIGEFCGMITRLIREDIRIKTVLDATLGAVKADATQMQQVLLNLAVNARDAMADGGTLTIETSNIRLDAAYSSPHDEMAPGDYVLLSVSDTGCGMDAETLKNAFEPFFTTKGSGKGTGLGLATVYEIVKQHIGHILVYSKPGLGTTIKIYLPRVREAAAMKSTAPTPAATSIRGTETILIVEDENAVRRLTASALANLGYDIIEAPSGPIALTRAAERKRIHLLVTDVIMPEMNGRRVFEEMQAIHPGIKVLYVSGYTADAIAHHGILDEGVQLLQKPFTMQALAQNVRDVLSG